MNAAAPVIITRWEDAHLAKITVPQIQKSSKPDQSTTREDFEVLLFAFEGP